MPFEAERASALANAALADHSRASAIARDADESDDGTSKMSLRALVVGARELDLESARRRIRQVAQPKAMLPSTFS